MGKVGLQYWVFNESLLNYLLLHIGRCRLLIMAERNITKRMLHVGLEDSRGRL